MSQDLASRLRHLYSGDWGDVWARIERELPSNYWEENAVLGRRDTYARLLGRLERLGPLEGRRVLDAGCGRALLARRLAVAGAAVTAVDLVGAHLSDARERRGGDGPTYAVADFRDLLPAADSFDAVIVQEVLEEYDEAEIGMTLRALAKCRAARVYLIFRQRGALKGLIAPLLPEPLVATLDPVPLLRSVHLHTPYRLSHQESVQRRSYSVRMVELTL